MARLRTAEELGRLEIEMRLAALTSVVLAELSQGVSNEGELSRLQAALGAVRWVATSRDIYVRAGRIGFELRRRGVTIPITDCIAAAAESIGGRILTLGTHFAKISEVSALTVVPD